MHFIRLAITVWIGLVALGACADHHRLGIVTHDAGSSPDGGAPPSALLLVASNDVATHIRLDWTIASDEAFQSLLVQREGADLVVLPAGARSFEDVTAEPGSVSAPSALTATQGTRTDAVGLTWSAAPTLAGASHDYQILALRGDGSAVSSDVASGSRAAPAIVGYQISRDDGATWKDASADPSFADTAAPPCTLAVPAEAIARYPGNYIRLRITSQPAVTPPMPTTYRVRAKIAEGTGPQSGSASGYLGASNDVTYQWQRSAGDADANYTNLPGVTGALWFDDSAPLDEGRYYRAVLSAAGGAGTTPGVRAIARRVKNVSSGEAHSCAILSDDTVVCWGNNGNGEAPPGPSLATFKSVAAGDGYTCGILSDDTVSCWGDSTITGPPATKVKSLSMETSSSKTVTSDGITFFEQYRACALAMDGQILCWGKGTNSVPAEPLAGSWKSLSIDDHFGCGIADDDLVTCWGTTYPSLPAPTTDTYKSITVSDSHVCGIRTDNLAVCWGQYWGYWTPGPWAPTTDTFTSLATVSDDTCGLRSDNKLVCWGNYLASSIRRDVLATTTGNVTIGTLKAMSLGEAETCGIFADDKVICWPTHGGNNRNGTAWSDHKDETFKSISAGEGFACGIRSDGRMVCWGPNDGNRAPPDPSADLYASVSSAATHTCGLRTDGTVLCWGPYNECHQTGCAATPSILTATYKSISTAGDSYSNNTSGTSAYQSALTCGVQSDGKIACPDWTADAPPPWSASDVFQDVRVGTDHVCGLRVDGKAICFVTNTDYDFGQAAAPATETFTAISAGMRHTCGIRSDQHVVCWGQNDHGEAPRAPTAYTFKGVSAGEGYACGLRTDDRIVCWGDNSQGQAPPGPSLDRFQSVSAGSLTCAIRMDGRPLCWGNGFDL
jgi:alpha-tubulin suppressor-like RCC1 family protein